MVSVIIKSGQRGERKEGEKRNEESARVCVWVRGREREVGGGRERERERERRRSSVGCHYER